jgi:hypothetical protein
VNDYPDIVAGNNGRLKAVVAVRRNIISFTSILEVNNINKNNSASDIT